MQPVQRQGWNAASQPAVSREAHIRGPCVNRALLIKLGLGASHMKGWVPSQSRSLPGLRPTPIQVLLSVCPMRVGPWLPPGGQNHPALGSPTDAPQQPVFRGQGAGSSRSWVSKPFRTIPDQMPCGSGTQTVSRRWASQQGDTRLSSSTMQGSCSCQGFRRQLRTEPLFSTLLPRFPR